MLVSCSADDVLNELLSEASLEPSQAKGAQPFTPFAKVAIQQAKDPSPEGTRDSINHF